VTGHPGLAAEPAAQVVVMALGESAVQIELRCFLRDAREERKIYAELLEKAKLALDAADIQIAVPRRLVQMAAPVEVVDAR